MKLSFALLLIVVGSVFFQGCCNKPRVVRTHEENTTRVIESNPRIGQPVRSQ